MTNAEENIIENTKSFVKNRLHNAEGGHDWFHTLRVYKNAAQIAKEEKADVFVVSLAALLHDVADSKFNKGDETLGPKLARKFLLGENVDSVIIEKVVSIIENCSYRKSLDGNISYNTKELQIVQDADRLDAIGAIGIARAFSYGGFKMRPFYDPDIPPIEYGSSEEYKSSTAPTINHFYEKLLLLKNGMHTRTAKRIAEKRHVFMETYLNQFYKEWNAED